MREKIAGSCWLPGSATEKDFRAIGEGPVNRHCAVYRLCRVLSVAEPPLLLVERLIGVSRTLMLTSYNK